MKNLALACVLSLAMGLPAHAQRQVDWFSGTDYRTMWDDHLHHSTPTLRSTTRVDSMAHFGQPGLWPLSGGWTGTLGHRPALIHAADAETGEVIELPAEHHGLAGIGCDTCGHRCRLHGLLHRCRGLFGGCGLARHRIGLLTRCKLHLGCRHGLCGEACGCRHKCRRPLLDGSLLCRIRHACGHGLTRLGCCGRFAPTMGPIGPPIEIVPPASGYPGDVPPPPPAEETSASFTPAWPLPFRVFPALWEM